MFIAIEGIDGAGKTVQLEALAAHLMDKNAVITSEPTTTDLGGIIRQFLGGHSNISSTAIQLLFTADRAEHVDKMIIPQLAEGRIVITGRYFFSTIAFGIAAGLDKEWLKAINSRFPVPDATIVLDLDPEAAMKRVANRSSYKEIFENIEFQTKVRNAYLELKEDYQNYFIVNAARSKEEVSKDINSIVDKYQELL